MFSLRSLFCLISSLSLFLGLDMIHNLEFGLQRRARQARLLKSDTGATLSPQVESTIISQGLRFNEAVAGLS